MTDEIDVVTQNSTDYAKTDCTDDVLKSEEPEVIEISKVTAETDTECEVSESQITEECESISAVSMTKNKDCEHSSENKREEKISPDAEDRKSVIEHVESQNAEDKDAAVDDSEICPEEKSEEIAKHESSIKEGERQLSTDDKNRQSSVDDKSHPSPWSYSQWSENYESLEDEKPVEELAGDPQKLILWAAEKNELETLRKLLEEDPTLINARDNDLYTPLHRASYSNNVEVIKILLSYDADISSKTADGWEPLHCACKWDSVEAVSLLLQNGAEVNARTKGNITPLHLAASNVSGRRTLELLLWQPYIDPNIKTDAGDTAYDIAYRTGPLGALFEILEESVNVY